MSIHLNIFANLDRMFSLTLTERELYDLECLLLGAYNPLRGFLCEKDYLSVLKHMRLSSGDLWPIPITLSINAVQRQAIIASKEHGDAILLKDPQGIPLAKLTSIENKNRSRLASCNSGQHDHVRL